MNKVSSTLAFLLAVNFSGTVQAQNQAPKSAQTTPHAPVKGGAVKSSVVKTHFTGHFNATVVCNPERRCTGIGEGLTGSRLGAQIDVKQPGMSPVHAKIEVGANATAVIGSFHAAPVLRELDLWTESPVGTFFGGVRITPTFLNLDKVSPNTSSIFTPPTATPVRSFSAGFQRQFGDVTAAAALGFDGGGGEFDSVSDLVKVGAFGAIDAALTWSKKDHYVGAALRRTTDREVTINVAGLRQIQDFKLGAAVQATRTGTLWIRGTFDWSRGPHQAWLNVDAVGAQRAASLIGVGAAYAHWPDNNTRWALWGGSAVSAPAISGEFQPPALTFAVGVHGRIEPRH